MDINQSRPSGLFRRSTTILILGPLPPPYIGPAVATEMIMESELKTWFNLVHFDTSDHRSVTHIGKLDFRNISLATYHILKLPLYLIRHSPRIVYLPISQTVLGYFRDAIFILLSKVLGARVIIHLRGGYFRELYKKSIPFVKFVIRNSLKLVSRAIVLGKSLRYIFEGLVPSEKIAIVPNGIDKDYITDAEFNEAFKIKFNQLNELDILNERTLPRPLFRSHPPKFVASNQSESEVVGLNQMSFRNLFLSNLMLSKGFFDVIKSIPIIIKNNIPSPLMGEGEGEGESYIQFIFAGEFHEDERVKKEVFDYINTQNLSHFIKFIGMVDKEKKKELLLSADILVFPTYYRYEGQPWVIIEAMAAGLPIIATNMGCIKEMVIDGENGFIIEKQNPEQIAQKIIQLLENTELRKRMGQKSRERFLKYYTKEKFIKSLCKVFSDTIYNR